jgi:hypothetical protein
MSTDRLWLLKLVVELEFIVVVVVDVVVVEFEFCIDVVDDVVVDVVVLLFVVVETAEAIFIINVGEEFEEDDEFDVGDDDEGGRCKVLLLTIVLFCGERGGVLPVVVVTLNPFRKLPFPDIAFEILVLLLLLLLLFVGVLNPVDGMNSGALPRILDLAAI